MTGRIIATLACVFACVASAAAMTGGAAPGASDGAARHTVMLVGSRGTACSGSAIARNLVLTAAHCVLPGAAYKIVELDAARKPILKDVASIARHPQFDINALLAHRATADVAVLRLAAPLPDALTPVLLAPARTVKVGEKFIVAGFGSAASGDGRSVGTLRQAELVATGKPGSLQLRLYDPATRNERSGLGACTGDSGAPAFDLAGGTLAVIGVVSWSTGPQNAAGCGGLTGVTPLGRYRDWILETVRTMGVSAQ